MMNMMKIPKFLLSVNRRPTWLFQEAFSMLRSYLEQISATSRINRVWACNRCRITVIKAIIAHHQWETYVMASSTHDAELLLPSISHRVVVGSRKCDAACYVFLATHIEMRCKCSCILDKGIDAQRKSQPIETRSEQWLRLVWKCVVIESDEIKCEPTRSTISSSFLGRFVLCERWLLFITHPR